MVERTFLVFVLTLALVAAGCRRDEPETRKAPAEVKDARSVHVVDAKARAVEIALPVLRIVSLSWDGTEVIRAIGAADRIVGVNSTVAGDAAFWGELTKLPQFGGAFEPNCEAIAQLRPDVVVAYAMRPDKTFDEKMAKFGIPVVRLDCYKPARMAEDVRALAEILECREGAARLLAFIEMWTRVVEDRLAKIPDNQRPRVYVESYGDFRGSGPKTGGHAMCEIAGGRNICAALGTRNPKVSSEWVIEQNPEIILKAVSSSTGIGGYTAKSDEGMKRLRDDIAARTGWDRTAAVRGGRICLVSADAWLGPAYVAAQLQLAKWFYPDIFQDVEPRKVLLEYLQTFHGLTDTGVPFYP